LALRYLQIIFEQNLLACLFIFAVPMVDALDAKDRRTLPQFRGTRAHEGGRCTHANTSAGSAVFTLRRASRPDATHITMVKPRIKRMRKIVKFMGRPTKKSRVR